MRGPPLGTTSLGQTVCTLTFGLMYSRAVSNQERVIVVHVRYTFLKFMFSKKATKFEKIFTSDLTSWSKCQIDGEDFLNL